MKNVEGKRKHYLPIVNKLIKFYNKIVKEEEIFDLLEDNDDIYSIEAKFGDILFDFDVNFWDMYDDFYEYYGKINNYSIEDIL